MLALTSAYPEFMKAAEDTTSAIHHHPLILFNMPMTKVVIRQLVLNGFDVHHPLLDLQDYLGYPATLEWENKPAFTTGLKALRDGVLGKRKSCPLILFQDRN